MDLVLRAAAIYGFLMIIFRLAGRRTMASTSTFDFVLLLVISETVQQALTGGADNSLTGAVILVSTLVGIDILLSLLKFRIPKLDHWVDGTPLILVAKGVPFAGRLKRSRVTEEDILAAARENGVGRMAEIDYAVLEANGAITVLPKSAR